MIYVYLQHACCQPKTPMGQASRVLSLCFIALMLSKPSPCGFKVVYLARYFAIIPFVAFIPDQTEQTWSVSKLPYFMQFGVIISCFSSGGHCSFSADTPSLVWDPLLPSSVELPTNFSQFISLGLGYKTMICPSMSEKFILNTFLLPLTLCSFCYLVSFTKFFDSSSTRQDLSFCYLIVW